MQTADHDKHRWRFGAFTLDMGRGALLEGDREIKLRPKSFEMLRYLVEHHGVLVTKGELLDAVWGDAVVTEAVLTQGLIDIRRALDDRSRRLIRTVPRRGYIFDFAVTEADGLPVKSVRPRRGRARWLSAARVAAVAAAGAFVFYWGYRGAEPEAATGGSVESAASQRPRAPETRETVGRRSVAVLPFQDLSRRQDQEYFSDGLAEEILMSLAKLPELRVIARTSSFAFRGRESNLSAITDRLGVTHVLEGSVRTSGKRLRIAARLVETETEREIWSESYDRDASDALGVQGEIAASVANALELTLAADALPDEGGTQAGEAYAHYLQARFYYNRRGPGDRERAERHYALAVQIDPQFGRAWAGLAAARVVQMVEGTRPPEDALPAAGEAAEQALLHAPESAEAHARAAMYYWHSGDKEAAKEHHRRAQALAPNDPLIMAIAAGARAREGRLDEAIALLSRVVDLDPLGRVARHSLAIYLMGAGRYEEAEAQFRTSLELHPTSAPEYELWTGLILVLQGRFDEALEAIRAWPEGEDRDFGLALVRHSLGEPAASDVAFARLLASRSCRAVRRVAEVQAHRGRIDEAFAVLQDGLEREQRGTDMADRRSCLSADVQELRSSPFLRPLHADPRWEAYFDAAAGLR